MQPQTALTLLSLLGSLLGVGSLLVSQLWKGSVEVNGQLRKKMTPAGWVLVGLSVVGFTGTITAEIVRSRIRAAESASSEARSKELIAATQPLTALSLRLRFSTADRGLKNRLRDGSIRMRENAESSQGGSPAIPFDVAEYDHAVRPLLAYVAAIGPRVYDDRIENEGEKVDSRSIALVMPIDDANNAIVAFARIHRSVEWYKPDEDRDPADGADDASVELIGHQPRVRMLQPSDKTGTSPSGYEIDWTLDPAALEGSLHRVNPTIVTTAKLPATLQLAIFYDIGVLPFWKRNFARSFAPDLWATADKYTSKPVSVGDALVDVSLTVRLNGTEHEYRYRLKQLFRKVVESEYEDEIPARCTMLLFERS